MVKNRRTRSGCLTCRQRRVKCDEGQPNCLRCVRSGRECVKGWNIRFIHGHAEFLFQDWQTWMPVRGQQFSFVDETSETHAWYTDDYDTILSPSEDLQEATPTPRQFEEGNPFLDSSPIVLRTPSELQSPTRILHNYFSTLPIEQPKLLDTQEAFLLRHYITTFGGSLDICDPQRHFSSVVPDLATRSPVLLNAALAASAHHLSRVTDYDPLVADMYHERCVELLIPMLGELSSVPDEVIAATVLLRLYEQMSSAITGLDSERHLSGTGALMDSESSCATAGGIRQASFWIFLRQAIDVALNHQRPLKFNLEAYAGQMDLSVLWDDWAWANRMVWITAEVVAYVFARDNCQARLEELRTKIDTWWEQKPDSFGPLHVAPGAVFPEIYFVRPWHAIGMQYYYTAMILLLVADSSRLKLGVGYRESRQALEAEVAAHFSVLLGISTNGDDIQGRLGACHVVSVCAPWITDRMHQEATVRILRRLERENAWPTRAIALAAMEEWQWDAEDRQRALG
ncbi:hypothetical protein CDV55_107618 [Aspergillus turcosus]|nr:hypothetical protein CDV55_107618 [Aspergillus turcosus]